MCSPITSDRPPTLSARGASERDPAWPSLPAAAGPGVVLAGTAHAAGRDRPAGRAACSSNRGSIVACARARGSPRYRPVVGHPATARARAHRSPAHGDRADRVRQRRQHLRARRAQPPSAPPQSRKRARVDHLGHADLVDQLPDLRAVVLGARPRRPRSSRRRPRRATGLPVSPDERRPRPAALLAPAVLRLPVRVADERHGLLPH